MTLAHQLASGFANICAKDIIMTFPASFGFYVLCCESHRLTSVRPDGGLAYTLRVCICQAGARMALRKLGAMPTGGPAMRTATRTEKARKDAPATGSREPSAACVFVLARAAAI